LSRRLVVIGGADQGKSFPLVKVGLVAIGRSRKKTDIRLNDPNLARVHCRLELAPERVVAVDLNPSSRTRVNGRAITKQALHSGDLLELGETRLRFEADEAELQRPAPAKPARKIDLPPWATQIAGQELGHYKAGRAAALGHAGVVFQAHDSKHNRLAALKVLPPLFPDNQEERQRFAGAMKAMIPLRHRNLVAVYGAGKTAGLYWIAQEWVDGGSAARLIERQKKANEFSRRLALRVGVHIARALDFARQQHLIHRHISPANILWSKTEKAAKLNDLKFSKALEGSKLQELTMGQELLDDLPYLAPEQIQGTELSFGDDLSDLYSLGAVLYALLTGRPPFFGPTPQETGRMIHDTEPIPPSKSQPRTPPELEKIVLRLLAKRPEDRYPTPAELVADLEGFAKEKGVRV